MNPQAQLAMLRNILTAVEALNKDVQAANTKYQDTLRQLLDRAMNARAAEEPADQPAE